MNYVLLLSVEYPPPTHTHVICHALKFELLAYCAYVWLWYKCTSYWFVSNSSTRSHHNQPVGYRPRIDSTLICHNNVETMLNQQGWLPTGPHVFNTCSRHNLLKIRNFILNIDLVLLSTIGFCRWVISVDEMAYIRETHCDRDVLIQPK
jgi:hypothetical protein